MSVGHTDHILLTVYSSMELTRCDQDVQDQDLGTLLDCTNGMSLFNTI